VTIAERPPEGVAQLVVPFVVRARAAALDEKNVGQGVIWFVESWMPRIYRDPVCAARLRRKRPGVGLVTSSSLG
jgi:hypothetical protein